ncbi:3250_t:CDS:2 [Dentiscutata erythropus]|uniref:3250_t:CDS:1 n=1 Tax=Dentiscutata erythropus TaxID=1348616 RepID=A0A9N9J9N2_9GLOM|nr:3250_t:CDS:2 [Dentiscutata erythropus]
MVVFKVLNMSQLRATINRHNHLKEIELSMKQYKQTNVALPIFNNNISVVDNNSDDEEKETNKKNEQAISVDN